jgi:hypothetical protein
MTVDSEGGKGKSVCMKSPVFRRTGHLQHEVWEVKGTYAQVCAALRVSVSRRSHRLFLWMISLSARGSGRAKSGEMKKFKFTKIEISKLKNRQKAKS